VPPFILITGFMGAGKTCVAAELARRLECRMIDLDEFIAAREGRTPQQIIDEEGEPRFREMETRALRDVLERGEARVIALGGGAWTFERNRALIAQHGGFTVWLDAPFELCWQRIAGEGATRPLARDHAQARGLYDERRALYELAELHVQVSEGKDADDLAAEITEAIRRQGLKGGRTAD
jgi:shikimate kinase